MPVTAIRRPKYLLYATTQDLCKRIRKTAVYVDKHNELWYTACRVLEQAAVKLSHRVATRYRIRDC